MPAHLSMRDSLRAFTTTFSSEGTHNADAPLQTTVPLGGAGDENWVQKLTIRATGSTAAQLPDSVRIENGECNNEIAADLGPSDQLRPLGGEGFASIALLRGVQLICSADEVTQEEFLADAIATRVTTGELRFLDGEGEILHSMPFGVSQPGKNSIIVLALSAALTGVNSIRVHFTAFALATEVEVLTFAEVGEG